MKGKRRNRGQSHFGKGGGKDLSNHERGEKRSLSGRPQSRRRNKFEISWRLRISNGKKKAARYKGRESTGAKSCYSKKGHRAVSGGLILSRAKMKTCASRGDKREKSQKEKRGENNPRKSRLEKKKKYRRGVLEMDERR